MEGGDLTAPVEARDARAVWSPVLGVVGDPISSVEVVQQVDEHSPTYPKGGTRDDRWSRLEGEAYCYLTTVGRRTSRPHTIEIWFGLRGLTLYLLSGGGAGSDWVRNLSETPEVSVRIGRERFKGTARLVTEPGEDRAARDLLFAKYRASYAGDLSTWRDGALPIAVDLTMA